jgi:hypothetical protein
MICFSWIGAGAELVKDDCIPMSEPVSGLKLSTKFQPSMMDLVVHVGDMQAFARSGDHCGGGYFQHPNS